MQSVALEYFLFDLRMWCTQRLHAAAAAAAAARRVWQLNECVSCSCHAYIPNSKVALIFCQDHQEALVAPRSYVYFLSVSVLHERLINEKYY